MRYFKEREKHLDGTMGFSQEEVADGKFGRFIASLMEMGCEVHIWTDGCTWVVEYLRDTTTADGISFYPMDTNEEVCVDGKYVDWEQLEADGNK